MLTLRDILFGILLPSLMSAAVLLIAWRPWRKSAAGGGLWGPAVAMGAGFVAGVLGIWGIAKAQRFPPSDTTDWVLFLTPVLIVLAMGDVFLKSKFWVRWLIALGVSIGAAWLVLRPLLQADADPPENWQSIVAVGGAMFAAWLSLDLLMMRIRGTSLPLILTLVAAFTSAILMTSGSQKLGQMGLMLTATCAAMLVIAWWAGNVSLARGTAIVFVVIWLCLLMSGRFFAEVTPLHARLVFLAPFLAWLGEIPALRSRAKARFIVRIVAVLIPLLVAGGLAGASFAKVMSEKSDDSGTYD